MLHAPIHIGIKGGPWYFRRLHSKGYMFVLFLVNYGQVGQNFRGHPFGCGMDMS